MNRPRLPLGLEASRASLNSAVCEQLGQELATGRAARQLEVRDVAKRLLLSPAQVRGMEDADSEAFYSAEFYAAGVRKYAALVGVSSPLLDDVLESPLPDPAPSEVPPTVALARRLHVRSAPLAAGAAVLLLLLVGGWLVSLGVARGDEHETSQTPDLPTLQHLITTTLPPAPSLVTLVSPAPESGGNAAADEGYGHISVARTTWVFVRYQDNSTVERVLSPGDRFVLRGAPIYLAAGEAPGAEVVIVGRPVDPARFNVNGELRIGSAFLMAAVQR